MINGGEGGGQGREKKNARKQSEGKQTNWDRVSRARRVFPSDHPASQFKAGKFIEDFKLIFK